MVNFYHCAVESILNYGLLVWFSSCTRAEKEALHRVVKAAGGSLGWASQRSPQSSPPAAYARWITSYRTSSTQRTISTSDCPLDEDTVPSAPGPTDWPTASIHRLSVNCTFGLLLLFIYLYTIAYGRSIFIVGNVCHQVMVCQWWGWCSKHNFVFNSVEGQ